MTSTAYPVAAGFVANADAACSTLSGTPAHAYLSPAGMPVQSRFDITKSLWTRPDNVPIAFDLGSLFHPQGGPLVPLNYLVTAVRSTESIVWTGSNNPTLDSTEDCTDWTATTGTAYIAELIRASNSNSSLNYGGGNSCDSSFPVLCFED
jgi:hypothetical protein